MEPQFYVTGNNIPPEGDIAENSLFLRASDQKLLRYTNGEWKEIESSDTNSAKE